MTGVVSFAYRIYEALQSIASAVSQRFSLAVFASRAHDPVRLNAAFDVASTAMVAALAPAYLAWSWWQPTRPRSSSEKLGRGPLRRCRSSV